MFSYTAFDGFDILCQGSIQSVALSIKQRLKEHKTARVLIFSDITGRQIDLDLSGSEKQVLERLKMYSEPESSLKSAAGRPKLGVVPREISLLPRHWEWLINQDGGASAVIRNLIDEKMRSRPSDQIKMAQERTYKFLSALAGDLPHFEEAIRFLYRRDRKKIFELVSVWPKDVVKHAIFLAGEIF